MIGSVVSTLIGHTVLHRDPEPLQESPRVALFILFEDRGQLGNVLRVFREDAVKEGLPLRGQVHEDHPPVGSLVSESYFPLRSSKSVPSHRETPSR